MPRNWNAQVEDSNGLYVCDDFRQAMYQIVASQCLYLRFKKHATAYRIISRYRDDFQEALDLMGLKLRFKDDQDYCYVVPTVAKYLPVDRQETLFLLVLRQIYHTHALQGELTAEDEVVVALPEFMSVYESLTGEEFDKKASLLHTLIRSARRYGLAREVESPEDGDHQDFAIGILPAIVEVLSESAVGRVGAGLKAALLVQSERPETTTGESETEEEGR
jgi:hypothetical protein